MQTDEGEKVPKYNPTGIGQGVLGRKGSAQNLKNERPSVKEEVIKNEKYEMKDRKMNASHNQSIDNISEVNEKNEEANIEE